MSVNALIPTYKKFLSFLNYSRTYLIRNNPLKNVANEFVKNIKDFLTMNKKLKMAKYRVNYQKYKLAQFEKLIAQNNEHFFIRGRTLNETR